MGIDGIGKPASPSPIGETSTLGSPEIGLEPSRATRSEAPNALNATESSLLERLEQGQLTRDQYLDQRVDEAVSPYCKQLPPDLLDHVRATLREQLELDPLLVELVRRATEHGTER